MEQGYQLETDSLGGNPILRRLKDDEVVRPLSANRNIIKALEERGLIHSGKGNDPLRGSGIPIRNGSWRRSDASCDNETPLCAEGTERRGGSKSLKSTSMLPAKRIGIPDITSPRLSLFRLFASIRRTPSRILFDAMGIDSLLGERRIRGGKDD
jgi:hypothetical protein